MKQCHWCHQWNLLECRQCLRLQPTALTTLTPLLTVADTVEWFSQCTMQPPHCKECSALLVWDLGFLWEPLSSSNESWETIGEGKEAGSSGSSKSDATDKSSFAKPPLHGRSKPKSNFTARFKSKGSLGSRSASSLGSIDEGIDCDDHSL